MHIDKTVLQESKHMTVWMICPVAHLTPVLVFYCEALLCNAWPNIFLYIDSWKIKSFHSDKNILLPGFCTS